MDFVVGFSSSNSKGQKWSNGKDCSTNHSPNPLPGATEGVTVLLYYNIKMERRAAEVTFTDFNTQIFS
jgi:hypothetical protein